MGTLENNVKLTPLFFLIERPAMPTLMTSTCSTGVLTGSGFGAVLLLAGFTSANARPTGWRFQKKKSKAS